MSLTRLPLRSSVSVTNTCLRCFSSAPRKQGMAFNPIFPSSHLHISLSPEPLLNLLQMTPSSPSSAAALAGTPQQISRELAADSSERASPGRLASTATHKTAKSWSRRGGVSISATYTANGNQETYTPHMIFLAPSRRSGNLAGRSQAKTHSMCWVSIPSWSTR